MVSLGLVFDTLLVVAAVLLVAAATLIAHAIVRKIEERNGRREERVARDLLAQGLTDHGKLWGGRFKRLPLQTQRTVFMEAGRSLKGADKVELTELAQEAGLLDHAERQCRHRRWNQRLAGARFFAGVGGGDDVMVRLLDDPSPLVRAEAILWAKTNLDLVPIEHLFQRLGTDSPLERSVAVTAIIDIGVPAVAPLGRFLQAARGRARVGALRVAAGLADGALLAPTIGCASDPEPDVRRLVARVCGRMGGNEAREALLRLLRDPAPTVRAEATRALGRMRAVQAAPALAGMLDDPDRDTRHGAALALRQLGGPGVLLLRRRAQAESDRGARLARSALEVPDASFREGVV